jgi:hypothetical protein
VGSFFNEWPEGSTLSPSGYGEIQKDIGNKNWMKIVWSSKERPPQSGD